MNNHKPYTFEDIPELPFAEVEHRIFATVCEVARLKELQAASVAEVTRLQSFCAEWSEKDGNSPGYNLEKAKTYGRIAAGLRVQLAGTKDSLGEADRAVQDHYMRLVNFANREASRFQEMLLSERKEIERLKGLVELSERDHKRQAR